MNFLSSLHHEGINRLVSWSSYNFTTNCVLNHSSRSLILCYFGTSVGWKNSMHPSFSSLMKQFFPSVWSMSLLRTSMQGKTRFLRATMCKYDRRILGNTWSSSALTSRSLCGIYSWYYSLLIMLNRSPNCGSTTLDPVLASISPKARGWKKNFFVFILTAGSGLEMYSNCLMIPREEPSPISGYFRFGSLLERLVVGFLDDIFSTT
jgi:hypothetical protein